jgi:pimeloyl-ACP methyl ester carboxylesterase
MQPTGGSVRYLLAGAFHELAYVAWGNPAADVVLCVHGLTRNGRDFDPLARALADRFHVICPDLPGRGASDWLPDPALYQPASYVAALSHLLAAIGRPVAWVGTSLGGICGMVVAAAAGQPITRLVLNDIGPFIPAASLRRIRDYLPGAEAPRFADMAAIEQHLRRVHAPFGPLSDDQWAFLAGISARAAPGEGFVLHYDPAIAEPMRGAEPDDIDLWTPWERIRVPVLVVRGAESDLLLSETLARMAETGAETFVVPGTGHAPALMDREQIAAVRAFLVSA